MLFKYNRDNEFFRKCHNGAPLCGRDPMWVGPPTFHTYLHVMSLFIIITRMEYYLYLCFTKLGYYLYLRFTGMEYYHIESGKQPHVR